MKALSNANEIKIVPLNGRNIQYNKRELDINNFDVISLNACMGLPIGGVESWGGVPPYRMQIEMHLFQGQPDPQTGQNVLGYAVDSSNGNLYITNGDGKLGSNGYSEVDFNKSYCNLRVTDSSGNSVVVSIVD